MQSPRAYAFNNIRSHDLPISRLAFTGGDTVVKYLAAFAVNLFLTTNVDEPSA